MSLPSFTAITQNSSSVLGKALGDPAVEQLAQRLHIDLQDPATVSGLLAMTRQCVDESWTDAGIPKGMLAAASNPGLSRYGRTAIRAYQEVAAMA